ncbi:ATP-binding protein [archaeon]|nr:MAG: ATP-binding protein [archaeon]
MAVKFVQASVVDDLVTFLDNLDTSCQLMLVLCGIPGCGKSTFSKGLCEESWRYSCENPYKRHWRSFNQDALGSRNAVYREAEIALRHGDHIVIDRCNFDAEQRAHWLRLASGWRNTVVMALTLPHHTDVQVCEERATKRVDEIHDPMTNWHAVCVGMVRSFVSPSCREGFSYVLVCKDSRELASVQRILASM